MSRRTVLAFYVASTSLSAACLASSPSKATAKARVVWRQQQKLLIETSQVVLPEAPAPIQLPPDTFWTSWRPEGLYALVDVAGTEKGPAHLEVLKRAAGSTAWDLYAVLPEELNSVRAALPTADDRLFLVPNGAFLQVPGAADAAWAPFLLMGKDSQGKWTKFESVNLDWGPPFQQRPDSNGQSSRTKSIRRYNFLASAQIEAPELQDRLFELEDGWAALDRHHGMIWVFDAKGTVKRHISLYEAFKDEDLDLPLRAFPISVLACESAPEEKLILAVRNDVAFFISRKVWPINSNPQDPELAGSYRLRQAQAAKDFPEITWKVVDTKTGETRTIPAPEGLPSKYVFRPEDPNWYFHFEVGPDGQVESAKPSKPIPTPNPR